MMRSSRGVAGLLLLLCCLVWRTWGKQPHILYLLTDDQGYNDVEWGDAASYHTPNLKQLRDEGVELTQFYTPYKCTASRSSLMTGRYPYKIGTDSLMVYNKMKKGYLSLKYKLLPQYLKDLGYATHIMGKWHLGHCHVNSTPTHRGFDSFYGSYANNVDHYYHGNAAKGYDWMKNDKPDLKANGTYNTYLVTKQTNKVLKAHFKKRNADPIFLYLAYLPPHTPIQVPEQYKNSTRCRKLTEENGRRTNCGMMAAVDESIGLIIKTLKSLKVYDDFLILYHSDNGGSEVAGSSNYPLRGFKQTPYEGGTRVRTVIRAGPDFMSPNLAQYNNELMHVSDVLPTLVAAAGGNVSALPSDLDGMNMWDTITKGVKSQRSWMVYAADPARGVAAIRYKPDDKKDFKLVFWNNTDKSALPGWRPGDPRQPPDQYGPKLKVGLPNYADSFRLYDMKTNMYEYEPSQNVPDAGADPKNKATMKKMKAFMEQALKDAVPWTETEKIEFGDNWDGFHGPGTC